MYLNHFGLNEPPFKITPLTEFFYEGANRGATLEALVYAITQGEGIVKVIGEVGSGKTMLCRVLIERLPPNIELIYLSNPSLSRDEILYAIADDLNLDLGNNRVTVIIRALQDALVEKYAQGKQVVVLVDEAHAMPLETLEEIRLLSNLESSRNKLLQIVLFGQPELNENLDISQMRQLKERITHSFTLIPLVRTDVREYLDFRMRAAGYRGPEIFNPAALKLISNASEGLTRRINILADKALLAAFAENTHSIEARHVKAAIRDSEFKTKRLPNRYALAFLSLLVGLAIGWGWQFQSNTNAQHYSAATAIPKPITPAPVMVAPTVVEPVSAVPLVTASAVQQTASDINVVQQPLPVNHAAQVEPEKVTISVAPAPTPSAVPASSNKKNWVEERLKKTPGFLGRHANESYLIQLMLVESENAESLEKFLARAANLGEIEKIHVYKTTIKSKPKLAVVYGIYPSRTQANAALNDLPREFKTDDPILRTVKGIKDEIARDNQPLATLRPR